MTEDQATQYSPLAPWMSGFGLIALFLVGLVWFGGQGDDESTYPTRQTDDLIASDDPMWAQAQTPIPANADWLEAYPQGASQAIDGIEMVLVPSGCFEMGNSLTDDEAPPHEICFDAPFWIDRYEVTQGDFDRLDGEHAAIFEPGGNQYPANNLTWFEAQAFCKRRGMRLPTEAEWEYAARGPSNWVYPWGNRWDASRVVGNQDSPQPIGAQPDGASWVGAEDMSGNLLEWVLSRYDVYPYQANDGRNTTDDTQSRRVLRGGSWHHKNEGAFRAANRYQYTPFSGEGYGWGFRCVLGS